MEVIPLQDIDCMVCDFFGKNVDPVYYSEEYENLITVVVVKSNLNEVHDTFANIIINSDKDYYKKMCDMIMNFINTGITIKTWYSHGR